MEGCRPRRPWAVRPWPLQKNRISALSAPLREEISQRNGGLDVYFAKKHFYYEPHIYDGRLRRIRWVWNYAYWPVEAPATQSM